MEMLNGRRIFLIEDSVEHRVITRVVLGRHGARLEFDMWGRDTLQRLHAFAPIDVILVDLMLPGGISGFTIFEKIREDEKLKRIPIVAVSAADTSTALPKAQRMGFNGFIAKPVDVDLFPQQIAAIISGHNVWFSGMNHRDALANY